jgi:hypothetical protein
MEKARKTQLGYAYNLLGARIGQFSNTVSIAV